MGTDQIMYCIVALLLGMLLANMLKNVCGCNVVEGQCIINPELDKLQGNQDIISFCNNSKSRHPERPCDIGITEYENWNNHQSLKDILNTEDVHKPNLCSPPPPPPSCHPNEHMKNGKCYTKCSSQQYVKGDNLSQVGDMNNWPRSCSRINEKGNFDGKDCHEFYQKGPATNYAGDGHVAKKNDIVTVCGYDNDNKCVATIEGECILESDAEIRTYNVYASQASWTW
jgi:hypothetical protein